MRHARALILTKNVVDGLSPEHESELIKLSRPDGQQSHNLLNPT